MGARLHVTGCGCGVWLWVWVRVCAGKHVWLGVSVCKHKHDCTYDNCAACHRVLQGG